MVSLCPLERTHCTESTKCYIQGSINRQFRRNGFKQIIAEREEHERKFLKRKKLTRQLIAYCHRSPVLQGRSKLWLPFCHPLCAEWLSTMTLPAAQPASLVSHTFLTLSVHRMVQPYPTVKLCVGRSNGQWAGAASSKIPNPEGLPPARSWNPTVGEKFSSPSQKSHISAPSGGWGRRIMSSKPVWAT
jgi:hypothetical protein